MKQIQAVHRYLRSQPRKPPHHIAPPVPFLCSLGNAPIHSAAATPTFIAIATPPPFPPPPPPLGHHIATHPPVGLQRRAARTPRGVRWSRSAIEKSLGGERRHHFEVERVCSPLGLPGRAALATFDLAVYIIVSLINTVQMIYIYYIL